ncbi:MAG: acyl-CoA dehydrogenase C-terminal domain-containing protein, partial [Actinobacteria bacterium]|nr:acyl-CoA dehydrogenase C-terminal domain-containing protein [Actinomycetota bacterium]
NAALEAGADGADADFYTGKVASARYWTQTVLPKVELRRELTETTDLSLMELPDAAF